MPANAFGPTLPSIRVRKSRPPQREQGIEESHRSSKKCLFFFALFTRFKRPATVIDFIFQLEKLTPEIVFPMHGSCIDKSMFPKCTKAIMDNEFAFDGMLLGQKLEVGGPLHV